MAQVLHVLAPLVQVLDGGLPAGDGERSPAASVDPLDALAHARPPVVHVAPVIQAFEGITRSGGDDREGALVIEHLLADLALMAYQFPPHGRERCARTPRVRVRDLVERVDQDLRVSHLAQRSGRLTKRGVLSPVDLLGYRGAYQSENRPKPLQALASFVHHRVARALGRSTHVLADLLELALRDPVHAVSKPLACPKLERHRRPESRARRPARARGERPR